MPGKAAAVHDGNALLDAPGARTPRGRASILPRPFLKWAGGKGQLVDDLFDRVARAGAWRDYHEPFVGGGALFFGLHRAGLLAGKRVHLRDTNPNLIVVWTTVRDALPALEEALAEHTHKHDEDWYYRVRAETPTDDVARAARVIYLNKTGFNGLYRENSQGRFNVPFGRHTNPTILDTENLRACHAALQGVDIAVHPFEHVLDEAQPGDLVYFDPPYDPVSASSSFTKYAKDDFLPEDQERLRDVYTELARRGVKAILSNSDTPLIRELYAPFGPETVLATRSVNRDADKRGAIPETLVCNFGADGVPVVPQALRDVRPETFAAPPRVPSKRGRKPRLQG